MVAVYRPVDLDEALEIRAQRDTVILAGGTDLMVKNRTWSGVLPAFNRPVVLIGHLPQLQQIQVEQNTLSIGAAATLAEILEHPLVPDAVKRPLGQMASPSVRSLATLGGNVCNSSPAGDSLPMLYALGAVLRVQSTASIREVPVCDFITGPGSNILAKHEIATALMIPLEGFDHVYYKKVGARKANAISKASFYAAARIRDGKIQDVRMAFGAVAPKPVRSPAAEELLRDVEQDQVPCLAEAVASHYSLLFHPIDDSRSTSRYRHRVAMLMLQNYLLHELTGR